jgi:hypothetical protein
MARSKAPKAVDGPVVYDGERYVLLPEDGHDLLTEEDIKNCPTVVVHDGEFILESDVPADDEGEE